MPRRLAPILGVLALVLSVLAVTAAPASASSVRSWSLSGVTFADGGTMTGTILIDAGGTPFSADLKVSGGDTSTFPAYEYTGSPQALANTGGWYLWRSDFGTYVAFFLPDTTSASEGDTLALPSGGYECTNCASVRYITAGSIVADGLVDLDGPVITSSVDPADPDGQNGWYVGSPTVSFDVSDPDSAISDQTGCAQQTVSTDTVGTTLTCQATSGGGTSSADVSLRRDATPPELAPALTTKRVLLGGRVRVLAHASDATSGIATRACDGPSSRRAGVQVVTCTATDVAGNSSSADLRYTVQYLMKPLRGTRDWRAGDQVTVRTRLTNASGQAISNKQAAALGCRVQLRERGAQSHRTCLTYHRATHTFSATWTLGRRSGVSEVQVRVSYPGSKVHTSRTASVRIAGPAAG